MSASRSRPMSVFSVLVRPLVPIFSVLLLALLIVAPVQVSAAAPVGYGVLQQQLDPPDEPVPEVPAGVALLIALSAQVTAIVEGFKRLYIKPAADRNGWSENHYVGVLTALGILCGIGSAFIAGPDADLLRMVGVTFLPPAIGILMSGILISFGQVGIHWGFDGLRDLVMLLRAYGFKLASEAEATPTVAALSGTTALVATSPGESLAAVVGTPEHEDYLKRFAAILYDQWNAGNTGSAPDPIPKTPVPSPN